MRWLVLGLVLFVAVHCVPMLPHLRARLVARFGENGWRGLHSLIAAVGLGLVVWGFGVARFEGTAPYWDQIPALRHPTLLVLLPVFPLIFASFRPGWIAAKVPHPMVTGVGLWAFGHLLIVGSAPAVAIAGTFLVWTFVARRSLMRRKPPRGETPAFGRADALAVVLGLVVYGLYLWKIHLWTIGVSPLG